ncbi:MAG TPA: aminopeptidase [Desulfobacteraceae bacterium]|nr:aminopeptidase [Desulfobacteraceae bacterium]
MMRLNGIQKQQVQHRLPALVRAAVLCLCLITASGCVSPSYYAHVSFHHLDVMAARQPVERLIASPGTPDDLREKLILSREIRRFASDELLLPDNGSYTAYADLERPYLMWTVVATPEFSLTPVTWDFLFAGRLSYRGFYTREKADSFAEAQRAMGRDVTIAEVPAYSTLGWFDDPLLSSFIHWPEAELAALIFHELAHQKLYVRGDTEFNESFAEAVADIGVARWFLSRNDPESTTHYRENKAVYDRFIRLLLETANALTALYETALTDVEKRRGKAAVFDALKERYARLKKEDTRFKRFDRWFSLPMNNARFALLSTYHGLVPGFYGLLDQCGGDLARFYEKTEALEALSHDGRRAALNFKIPDSGTVPGGRHR